MKGFNKVANVIMTIVMAITVLVICIVGINEIYYQLPSGIDTPLSWLLCILAGGKIGTWTTNEVARIIKG